MLLKSGFIVEVEDCNNYDEFRTGDIAIEKPICRRFIVKKNEEVKVRNNDKLHLHLLVMSDAGKGDYIFEDEKIVRLKEKKEDVALVVATTDKSIPLARFPKSFLHDYIKGDAKREKIFVKHVEFLGEIIPEKNKNNIIQLKDLKENFDREAVIDLFFKFCGDMSIPNTKVEEWLDKNI